MTAMRIHWQCIRCSRALDVKANVPGVDYCPNCGQEYSHEPGYFRTFFQSLLFERYKKKYLLNRVLNNNAYLSYVFIPERSVSLPERKDVQNFRGFVWEHLLDGPILDVGCGPLPLPGYLQIPSLFETREVFGLDPMDNISFQGIRVLGCAEFTPFPDEYISNLIFGTSLDHVVCLKQTIREAMRILRPGGRVIIWMGDRHRPFFKRISTWISSNIKSLFVGYDIRRYGIYPDLRLVLYIPSGAYDAYHSWAETPRTIKVQMAKAGFHLVEERKPVEKQAYLCFAKEPVGDLLE